MPRPFTFFTGQWADLPLEEVARLASSWGYDGLELACWGDHFEVDRALGEDGYLAGRHALLRSTACAAGRSRTTSSARRCATTRSTSGTRASCPPASGATATPKACGSGPRRRWRTRRGRRPRSACDTVVGFTGSSIWHTVAMFPPAPGVDDRARVRGLRAGAGTRSSTCSRPRACGSRTRCTRPRSPTTSGRRPAPWRPWSTGPRSA